MKKRNKYENDLVISYAEYLESDGAIILCKDCRSKKNFDFQYVLNGETWCFEAKSHMSGDAYNGVHKLFGELLKDATRILKNGNKTWRLGILLDGRHSDEVNSNGFEFYSRRFSELNKDLLVRFGKIVKVEKVVFYDLDLQEPPQEFAWSDYIDTLYNN